jgi:hypothetical protein
VWNYERELSHSGDNIYECTIKAWYQLMERVEVYVSVSCSLMSTVWNNNLYVHTFCGDGKADGL